MGRGVKRFIGWVALVAVGVAAGLALSGGDGTTPADAAPAVSYEVIGPEQMRVAGGASPTALRAKGRRRNPRITDLISNEPITIGPGAALVIVVTCGSSRGVALDGGIVTTPGSSSVVASVLSRWNPNTLMTSRRTYYVGAHNLDPAQSGSFRPSLVCAKGIDVR